MADGACEAAMAAASSGDFSPYHLAVLFSGACFVCVFSDFTVRYIVPIFQKKTVVVDGTPEATLVNECGNGVLSRPPRDERTREARFHQTTTKVVEQTASFKYDVRRHQVEETMTSDDADAVGGLPSELLAVDGDTNVKRSQQILSRTSEYLDDTVNGYTEQLQQLRRTFFADYRTYFDLALDEQIFSAECKETVDEVRTLEKDCQDFSGRISQKAVALVDAELKLRENDLDGSLAKQRDHLVAIRGSWSRLYRLFHCLDVHMRNATEYHLFYHEAFEYEAKLKEGLVQLMTNLEKEEIGREDAKPKDNNPANMLNEVKEITNVFKRWELKMNDLVERSKKVVPLKLRTQPADEPLLARSLCTLNIKGVSLIEGEEIYILDNNKPNTWQVRNSLGEELWVPSVCVSIPPPDKNALDMMLRLRTQLLAAWTASMKQIGKRLIGLMVQNLHGHAQKKDSWKVVTKGNKEEISRILDILESTLGEYWKAYGGYEELEQVIGKVRAMLEKATSSGDEDTLMAGTILGEIQQLEKLLAKYQSMWGSWECYKAMVQTSGDSRYMLMVDAWEQLQMVSTTEFLNYWHSELTKEDLERIETESKMQLAIRRERAEAQTTQYSTSSGEVQETFSITAVVHPITKQEITMSEAVKLGIINQSQGNYVHLATRERTPIHSAMAQGLIKVESSRKKAAKEQHHSVGILTITITRETRPYTITAVIDPRTEESLTIEEASQRGVYDAEKECYCNPDSGERVELADAIDMGGLEVEFDPEEEATEPEVINKTYAVYAVTDQKTNTRVSYHEAVERGIIDLGTGVYIDNVTKEEMYLAEALKRGYVKALLVDDQDSIDSALKGETSLGADDIVIDVTKKQNTNGITA